MNRKFYLTTLLAAILTLAACKKDTVETEFEDELHQPYTTGLIKFQYSVPAIVDGISSAKDTTVHFTSRGNNQAEFNDYGYSKPSQPWVQLHRINPNDFQNRAFIFFVGTNLNTLTFPYKFQAGNAAMNAQINYTIGLRPYYDNGVLVLGTNTYAATTYFNDFELTVLSRVNNRLQGLFSGTLKNQDGHSIYIRKGLFDIAIVDR